MALAPATLLGPFEVVAPIGKGGMGEVYKARDSKLDRTVALKILPPEFAGDQDRLERFLREAKAASAIDHPNVAHIYEIGEARGTHYIAMQYVAGEPVSARLKGEPRKITDILTIALQLADALQAAHARGIVHRDIKPANLMLTAGDHLKVLDFGLAKVGPRGGAAIPDESHAPTEAKTAPGVVMGTVCYMSPEQALGREVDGRSDLFSMGVVLYELTTGRLPFCGNSTTDTIDRITHSQPDAIARFHYDVPPELDRIVRKCLEKDPAERYQSALDLLVDLRKLKRDTESGSSVASAPTASPAGPERRAIVVLPFANLSPDPENEYFSDGLTEEIIGDLSKVKALSVISRTSSMRLKGAQKDVRTIGRELGVRYVLEGSVRKAGNSLRITAQLVDATSDAQLWADKWSGTLDDAFEAQERVSREIVRALDVTLTKDEDRRLAHRSIANVRAFELYLQARQELRRMGGANTERAAKLLSEAVAIEGATAPLRALQAWAKVTKVRGGLNRDLRPLDEAEKDAHEVLAQAPESPYGHALLGYVAYERGHMPEAVRHFRKALEREPNDADSLFYMGIAYIAGGQNDEARETAERLVACDPLASLAWMLLGVTRWFVGRFDQAPEDFARGLDFDPQSFILHWTAGYTRAALGQLTEAARHAAFLHEAGPNVPYTRQLLALIDGLEGREQAALDRLVPLETAPLDAHNKFHLAESFAMAGALDPALDLLERAVDEGFYPHPFIALHCPFLAPLRATPRFAAIAAQAQRRTSAFGRR